MPKYPNARRINRDACRKMEDENLVWYVVFVQHGKEMKAQALLQRKEIGTYLPLQVKWRKINRYSIQRQKVTMPALGGCMFCAVGEGENPKGNENIINVARGILSVKGVPAKINGEVLRQFVGKNKNLFSLTNENQSGKKINLQAGDCAQITGGILKGQLVDVSKVDAKTALIFSHLFGTSRKIKFRLTI